VSEHNITKPDWRTWGMVNAAVVQGKIMLYSQYEPTGSRKR